MKPIVFLDTETTSLGPKREPWEIAMIRRDGDERKEISFFVQIDDLPSADLMSLKIGGFYDRYPGYASLRTDSKIWSKGSAAYQIEQWTRNALIVGAVPNFDTEVLSTLLRGVGSLPSWHYHLIDVENLAVGWLRGLVSEERSDGTLEPPWDSDALSRACGVEPPSDEDRHTAMGDTLWVERWYDKIMGIR